MALWIIGTVLLIVALVVAVLVGEVDDESAKGALAFIGGVVFIAGWMMLTVGMQSMAHKQDLDGLNPYVKEYRYKAMPDGEMVVVDSVYVRVE